MQMLTHLRKKFEKSESLNVKDNPKGSLFYSVDDTLGSENHRNRLLEAPFSDKVPKQITH